MKKLVFILSFILVNHLFAQDADQVIQQFLEERKKMMEEIMKAFDEDDFFKDDFFDDKMFDSLKRNGFRGYHGFSSSGNNVKVDEKVNEDGTMSILITPKNKNMKLDIQTTETQIVIRSEILEDVKNESKDGIQRSYSKSSFSQTIRIPQGYKAENPKKEGESLVITLVPTKSILKPVQPNKNGRKPIIKTEDDETI